MNSYLVGKIIRPARELYVYKEVESSDVVSDRIAKST